MNNKKLGFLFLALAIVASVLYFVTHSTFYIVLAAVNICTALAGLFNNRTASLVFMLLGAAGMIYFLINVIMSIFA